MQIEFGQSFFSGLGIGILIGAILSSLALYFVGLIFSFYYTTETKKPDESKI